eukprot:GILK01009099.1.p1 GENE.GILK01009099.1~~GILK01009099.1.p1  ORF type:complete len:232 (+),score=19.20 GILK01009099.1:44-697(+)
MSSAWSRVPQNLVDSVEVLYKVAIQSHERTHKRQGLDHRSCKICEYIRMSFSISSYPIARAHLQEVARSTSQSVAHISGTSDNSLDSTMSSVSSISSAIIGESSASSSLSSVSSMPSCSSHSSFSLSLPLDLGTFEHQSLDGSNGSAMNFSLQETSATSSNDQSGKNPSKRVASEEEKTESKRRKLSSKVQVPSSNPITAYFTKPRLAQPMPTSASL